MSPRSVRFLKTKDELRLNVSFCIQSQNFVLGSNFYLSLAALYILFCAYAPVSSVTVRGQLGLAYKYLFLVAREKKDGFFVATKRV